MAITERAFFRICFKLVWIKWSTNTACIMAILMSYALWVKGRILKGIRPQVSFFKSMVCSATETGTGCLMHHNTRNRRPVNSIYLLAFNFPLHCISFMFASVLLLNVGQFVYLTYHSFLSCRFYHFLWSNCDLMFHIIRDLNHQNNLDKNFSSLIRAKDKLGKANLSFRAIISDTGFLSRKLWANVVVL